MARRKFTAAECREAMVKALEAEWKKVIRDRQWISRAHIEKMQALGVPQSKLQSNTEGDTGHITRIIRSCGWLASRVYSEAKGDAWCGFTVGHAGMHLGEYLVPGACIDVSLKPKIAKYVLPSTVRLASRAKWLQAGFVKKPDTFAIDPMDLQRGDIITVKTSGKRPRRGDHYEVVLGPPQEVDGVFRVPVIGGNGYGWLGNGKWGEGLYIRTSTTPQLMRRLEDVRQICRLDHRAFEGSAFDPT